MSKSKAAVSPPVTDREQVDPVEYQALETALLQTVRGRSFLAEYLHRNGGGGNAVAAPPCPAEPGAPVATDTDRILQAVENLHDAVMTRQEPSSADHLRMDILEMAKAIAKTRTEISAMRTDGEYDHLSVASEEMDAIVLSTEKATNDILQAAEKIQEVAWHLRETGTNEASCEDIDNSATDIYMACSFQDLTGQRTTKVVRVLQYLEARINSMIEIWGLAENEAGEQPEGGESPNPSPSPSFSTMEERPDAHLLNGPQAQELALEQDNIDALLADEVLAVPVGGDDAGGGNDAETDVFNMSTADDAINEEQLKALFN